MKDKQLEDFKLWLETQPDQSSYTRVRNFLTDHLSCSKSAAEIEMAKLARDGHIKIISLKSRDSGRRIFPLPLPKLTKRHIVSVWPNGSNVSQDVNKIAVTLHDRYGYDVSDVKQFMHTLPDASIQDGKFRWQEAPDDSDEYIR